jgi:hypothetical protein
MVRISSIAATLAVVFLLIGGAPARCDFIPWRIDAGFGSPGVGWGVSGVPTANGNIAEFALSPLYNPILRSGSARIDLLYVSADESPSEAATNFQDAYSNASAAGHYVMSLYLTDEASQRHTTLSFAGDIRAQFIPHHQPGAFVVNHFLQPTTQSARLGKNVYTVSLDPFTFASSNVYLTEVQALGLFWCFPNHG